MKIDEAKRILERPRFGDPLCIEAAQLLRDEAEAERLRPLVIGKKLICGPCGGYSDGCKFCDAEGMQLITKELADSWGLDIIQGVLDELQCSERTQPRRRA